MKAIVKERAGVGAVIKEVPIPKIKDDEVLVKVKATSICGTDLHIYSWDRWSQGRIKPPLIIGHEMSGEVVEKGSSVKGIRIGDNVSAETHITCGQCYQCKTGNQHVCKNLTILGVDVDGTFAEYVKIPYKNAWKNDESLPWEVASIQEPLGNAVHTVFAGGGPSGKTAFVFGCGPIGMMAIEISRALKASKIIASDISPYRLKLAGKFQPDHLIDAKKAGTINEVLKITDGEGVDILYEMSGSPSAFEEGLKLVKSGGSAFLLGIPKDKITFDIASDVIMKEVTLYGIAGRKMFETWEQMRELLDSKRIDVSPIITHRIRLEEFERGMALMESGECGKVVMTI